MALEDAISEYAYTYTRGGIPASSGSISTSVSVENARTELASAQAAQSDAQAKYDAIIGLAQ